MKLSNLYSESLAEVIKSSDLDKLKLLLDNGLEPSNLYSETSAEVIKSIEDLKKLGLLLSKGLKVSYPLPEKLVSAIKSTNMEQLKHLLDNGLKFNEIFSYSISSVLDAIRSSDTEKLKLLLDSGLINRLPIVDVLNHHDVDDLKFLD